MALALALVCLSQPARANPGVAAIEIDPRAEALVDARALRRRVELELADLTVLPPPGEREAALFFRVLYAGNGQLRIELWERGVAYGSRVVAGSTDAGPLFARRVALAAAELARELSDTREDEAADRLEAKRRKLELERAARRRTLDGPRALRVGAAGAWSPKFAELGPELAAELHVYRRERLDLDAATGFGAAARGSALEMLTLGLGPARRFVLGPRWDLDLGLRGAASLLEFSGARGVDGIARERQSWTAILEARVRLEPRLSREVRLVVGVGAGTLLRRVPLELADGRKKDIEGPFLAGEIALVLTPL
ncbi:MAG TPA: hypothetical protein VMI54_11090 [Polyangiaceae bacterium]|nr:hypothetical protein [Polyangiaceae bacterium]